MTSFFPAVGGKKQADRWQIKAEERVKTESKTAGTGKG